MSRYQQAYNQMLAQNQTLFDEFTLIHAAYLADPQTAKPKFNEVGKKILSIIQDHDRRLCSQTERGGYSRYSANLSEKFWALVRTHFPKIDLVGTK